MTERLLTTLATAKEHFRRVDEEAEKEENELQDA